MTRPTLRMRSVLLGTHVLGTRTAGVLQPALALMIEQIVASMNQRLQPLLSAVSHACLLCCGQFARDCARMWPDSGQNRSADTLCCGQLCHAASRQAALPFCQAANLLHSLLSA